MEGSGFEVEKSKATMRFLSETANVETSVPKKPLKPKP